MSLLLKCVERMSLALIRPQNSILISFQGRLFKVWNPVGRVIQCERVFSIQALVPSPLFRHRHHSFYVPLQSHALNTDQYCVVHIVDTETKFQRS
jgi:hypothetical protein